MNSHSLTIFSTTVHLREVIYALWKSKKVPASAYEGVRLWEVRNIELQTHVIYSGVSCGSDTFLPYQNHFLISTTSRTSQRSTVEP